MDVQTLKSLTVGDHIAWSFALPELGDGSIQPHVFRIISIEKVMKPHIEEPYWKGDDVNFGPAREFRLRPHRSKRPNRIFTLIVPEDYDTEKYVYFKEFHDNIPLDQIVKVLNVTDKP